LKGLRLTFEQSITCGDDELIAAVVTVVLVNREGKPRRYPVELQDLLGVAAP